MGNYSNIQWCDSTVNGTTGCDGCELWPGPCYAGYLHTTRLALSLPALYARDFTEVRLAPGRMVKAAGWADMRGRARPTKPWIPPETPRLIFVGDMGDLFSKAVPFDYVYKEVIVNARSAKGSRHNWLLLTKYPRRMAEFADLLISQNDPWPENVWAGTSVTRAKTLSRLDHLKRVPARIRYVSVEPMLENIDLTPYLRWLSWAILGGESDQSPHKARPFDLACARSIRDQCKTAGVPFFLKQLGSRPYDSNIKMHARNQERVTNEVSLRDSHGGDMTEWPEDLRVREMPEVGAVVTGASS